MKKIQTNVMIAVFLITLSVTSVISYASDDITQIENTMAVSEEPVSLTQEVPEDAVENITILSEETETEAETGEEISDSVDEVADVPEGDASILSIEEQEETLLTGETDGQAEEADLQLTDVATKPEVKTVKTPIKSLAVPSLKKTKAAKKGITVTWDAVDNAKNYKIRRKTDGGKWELLGTSATTSYTDKTAKAGILYYYTVTAYAGKIHSKQNSKGIAGLYLPKTTITSIKNQARLIVLKWKTVKKATGYRIYRREAGEKKWQKLADVKKVTSFKDTTVASGKTYEYYIVANKKIDKQNHLGFWDETSVQTATHLKEPVLQQADSKNDGITLQWKKAKGAKKYRIYRKAGTRGGWKLIATTADTTYVDKKAISGRSYTYTISALNGKSRSVYGKQSLTAFYLARAVLSKAVNAKKCVQLSWPSVQGAVSYRIYRRLPNKGWRTISKAIYLTSYNDTTAESGVTYEYGVRACRLVNGTFVFSELLSTDAKRITRLEVPSVDVELNENNGFSLTWKTVPGAEKYLVLRKMQGQKWTRLGYTTATKYADGQVSEGFYYTYTVKAVKGDSISSFQVSSQVRIPTDLDLPEKRYLNLGWNVDPRRTGGPAVYGSSATAVNKKYWTNHFTYGGDTYKPQAGDIITYGIPDEDGDTQGHVDICVSSYNEKTGTFGIISGNYGSWWQTSPIAYDDKSWNDFSKKNYSRTICNIWECKLSEKKKNALINTAWRMLYAYQENPDFVRGKILDAMYNPTNWCDAFVAYTIYIARY